MRTLKTIGYKILIKYKDCPFLFKTGPDFNTEKQAREQAERISQYDGIEEISVSVTGEELVMSIESEDKQKESFPTGFRSPEN